MEATLTRDVVSELTCICSKCGALIDVEYRTVKERDGRLVIVIEPRQDVQVLGVQMLVVHKPAGEYWSKLACNGVMNTLGEHEFDTIVQDKPIADFEPVERTGLYTNGSIKKRIKLLLSKGMKPKEVSETCSCDPSYVYLILEGKR